MGSSVPFQTGFCHNYLVVQRYFGRAAEIANKQFELYFDKFGQNF